MNYFRIKEILKEKGILNNGRDFKYGYNRTKFHSKYEGIGHFISKAMLSFLIFSKKGDGVVTECEMSNGRVIDILAITKSGNLIGYEINSTKPDKLEVKGVDVVDIPLGQMPETAKKGIEDLKKWLEEFIV
jgi:hypothetical protein